MSAQGPSSLHEVYRNSEKIRECFLYIYFAFIIAVYFDGKPLRNKIEVSIM